MRLFISIHLSKSIKNALLSVQNALHDSGVRGRYTPEENLHLTLVFIGEYPEAERVLAALSSVSFLPFDLTLDGLGRFDRLWWAGTKESVPLTAVVRRIHRALADDDIPFDRKQFHPHITLLRKACGEIPDIRIKPVTMKVDTISLMRSDQGKNGMIYTNLGNIRSCIGP